MKTFFAHLLIAAAASLAAIAADKSERLPGPLLDDLGEMHHPVTTSSSRAQRYFDQGLALCYGFNHREAIRSFRSALHLDPNCAMAWWGIAYASGPHVNRPMDPADNDRAWEAIQQAAALKHRLTPKERAYVDAMTARYSPALPDDRSALDRAYANAMRAVAEQFPDDLDAQTMLAESLMNLMPWDYWSKDRSPKPEIDEAMRALRSVLSRHPNHPGANHLYIHAVEAGPNPELALPSADRLAQQSLNAGHLVHMPSHIYMRVGQYHDAILANERAVRADRDYIRHCRAQGFYPGAYYPHNIHFLWWAQAFEGRSQESLRTARRAAQYAIDNFCGPVQVVEAPRLRHLPWITLARFGDWTRLLEIAMPPRTNDFLVDRAFWHFTRGLACASQGKVSAAERELAELTALVESEEAKQLDNPAFPVTGTLRVSVNWLAGKVAGAQGDSRAMIEHLERAVAAEDALPYMEPTFWPFPVRPALGAALLKAGQPVRAEAIFREDLQRWPRNAWGLFGLEQSLRQQGKTWSADRVGQEFQQAWKSADLELTLELF